MTNLAFQLSIFLREYLPNERRASQHTIDAYASTFQLLATFAADLLSTRPSKLTIENFDVTLIVNFLNHLETVRGNSPRTRNARIAAIKHSSASWSIDWYRVSISHGVFIQYQ